MTLRVRIISGSLETLGGAAFIAAGFLSGMVEGLIVTGAVSWLAAAFADWQGRR